MGQAHVVVLDSGTLMIESKVFMVRSAWYSVKCLLRLREIYRERIFTVWSFL